MATPEKRPEPGRSNNAMHRRPRRRDHERILAIRGRRVREGLDVLRRGINRRDRARRGDDAVPRVGQLFRPRTVAVTCRAHDGVFFRRSILFRRSKCPRFDALPSARVDRRASCRCRRPVCSLLDAGEAGYRSFLLASAPPSFRWSRLCSRGGGLAPPDWTRRTRAAALRADLADLGVTDVALATRRRSRERPACSARSMSSKDPGSAPGCWSPICSRAAAAGSGRYALPASRRGSPVVAIIPGASGILAGRAGMPRRGHRRRKNGVRLVHRRASRSRAPRPSGRSRDRRCRLTTARPST